MGRTLNALIHGVVVLQLPDGATCRRTLDTLSWADDNTDMIQLVAQLEHLYSAPPSLQAMALVTLRQNGVGPDQWHPSCQLALQKHAEVTRMVESIWDVEFAAVAHL